MDKRTLKKIIKSFGDEWYYYYDFDGIEVCKKLKENKTSGMHNWRDKLEPIIYDFSKKIIFPCVFDIGCNMCLYGHEISKMDIKVHAIDYNIEIAKFYKRYVEENLKEEWSVDLQKIDITKVKNLYFDDVNIITIFCVLYHLEPYANKVINDLSSWFPNHKYVIMQGNKSRTKRKKNPQSLAGVKGMKDILQRHNYDIHSVYKWNGYQKPVIVGKLR